jgi:hypothetical protein
MMYAMEHCQRTKVRLFIPQIKAASLIKSDVINGNSEIILAWWEVQEVSAKTIENGFYGSIPRI